MRTPWMYKMGAILLLFAAGLAVFIDAHYSYDWVRQHIAVNDQIATGLCFILAVLASSFGALLTNASSWLILFAHTIDSANIDNPHQRLLNQLGYGIVSLFLAVIFIAVYAINLLSNAHKTGNWFAAILICFASDAALMLSGPLWTMAKASKVRGQQLDVMIGGQSRTRSHKTIEM